LRAESVLILASGGATHNLREFGRHELAAPPVDYAAEFDAWLHDAVSRGDETALLDYTRRAPQAKRNHPTPEHFLPLFVAMGAGGEGAPGARVHASFTYGLLSMAAFAWGSVTPPEAI